MLHLLKKKKVAVKHSYSARDHIPWRLAFHSFPFSFGFHTSDRENPRPLLSGERRYLKSWFLVSVQCSGICVIISVDGRLIPRKKMLFQRTEKGVCSRRLGYMWAGPNVFNVFYFLHGLSASCALYIYNISFAWKAKSLYFTRRFEFPARVRPIRITVTFFSQWLIFYFKQLSD